MENKFDLGMLIRDEIARQKIPVTRFADMIFCQRANVYKQIKNRNIGLEALTNICKALKRNFFADLADNFQSVFPDSINPYAMDGETLLSACAEPTVEDIFGLFLETVPNILKKLGKKEDIYFPEGISDEDYIPDFMLDDYPITFTIGNSLSERLGKNIYADIETLRSADGLEVELVHIKISGSKVVNVPISDDMSQWSRLMRFAFECAEKNFCRIVKIFS